MWPYMVRCLHFRILEFPLNKRTGIMGTKNPTNTGETLEIIGLSNVFGETLIYWLIITFIAVPLVKWPQKELITTARNWQKVVDWAPCQSWSVPHLSPSPCHSPSSPNLCIALLCCSVGRLFFEAIVAMDQMRELPGVVLRCHHQMWRPQGGWRGA